MNGFKQHLMAELSIMQVTQQTGVRPSALRYYEEIGLIRPSRRVGGRRHYDAGVIQRLALIHTGQQAGFTLAELGILLNNALDSTASSVQWHALVERKLVEMDARLRDIQRMKGLLTDIMDCDDAILAECIVQTGEKHAQAASTPYSRP